MVMKHLESHLQSECIKWFRLQYPKFTMNLFAIPNGGSRNKIEAANLKRQGVIAGVADCFLSIPNSYSHGLFIEFKIGKNKQTENQIEFEKAISIFDYQYCVIYSFEEFVNTIESYLNIIK